MDLFELPVWLSAATVIILVVLLVVGPYGLTRALLRSRADTDTETLAGSVIFRIASLHGLILALVFAQEQVNYIQIRNASVNEASSLADIFFDFERYDPDTTKALRPAP
jgi:hypothetical protein